MFLQRNRGYISLLNVRAYFWTNYFRNTIFADCVASTVNFNCAVSCRILFNRIEIIRNVLITRNMPHELFFNGYAKFIIRYRFLYTWTIADKTRWHTDVKIDIFQKVR